MKTRLIIATVLNYFFMSASLAAPLWDTYFPTGKTVQAKVMDMNATPELQKITQKMKSALSENQEWFQKLIQQTPPGAPLPYHKNFGITKEEYQKVLNAAHSKLIQIGSIEVEFQRVNKDEIKITTKKDSLINGIIVSENEVKTPFGILKNKTSINNPNEDHPAGPWQGLRWSLSDYNESELKTKSLSEIKFKSIKFFAGKKANGENLIYFDVKDIEPKSERRIQTYFIIYY